MYPWSAILVERYAEVRLMLARYLTTAQAADFLNLSRFTLEKWRSRAVGPPYIKLGARVRYRLGDLEAYVCGQLVVAAS